MNVIATDPDSLKIFHLIEEINQFALCIGKKEAVFMNFNISLPRYTCSEAGFLRIISWLYVLFYESGRKSFDYLCEKIKVYSINGERETKANIHIILCLRTVLQHNLNLMDDRDNELIRNCEEWFYRASTVRMPKTSEHWEACLNCVLHDTLSVMNILKECLGKIANDDEFRETIIRDWNNRCFRFHFPYEYDQIISIVASDIGMDFLDVVTFRKRHYQVWSKELENLKGDYNFLDEARKRIERELLSNPVLPITGSDVIQYYKIQPGPKVGRILAKAREIFVNKFCLKEELLSELSHHIDLL